MNLKTHLIWPALAALAVLAVACGGSSSSSKTSSGSSSDGYTSTGTTVATVASTTLSSAASTPPSTPASAASSSAAAGGSTVLIGDSTAGKVLTDAKGMTLYTSTKDTPGTSTITGGVLQAWPALTLASGSPVKPAGLTGDLATITRTDDGTKQVTYKGLPLYHFMRDVKPGDVTGNNVGGFVVATP